MFNVTGLYGFCGDLDGGVRVFFHAGSFEREQGTPLPIVGEGVEVEYDPNSATGHQAPRADRVVRVNTPVSLHGHVVSFSRKSGWGFIRGDDERTYYLHRSEVEGGGLPLREQVVTFYAGHKGNKPRACYVRLGRVGAGDPRHDKNR